MWAAGIVAALSSMTYPAISTYVSTYADADKQGLVQGMITGVRGLCNGLGPAVFGLIFNLFHVDFTHNIISQLPNQRDGSAIVAGIGTLNRTDVHIIHNSYNELIPGPPFLFGAFLVFLAILVTAFIPELVHYNDYNYRHSSGIEQYSNDKSSKHGSRANNYYFTNIQHQKSYTQCVNTFDVKCSETNQEELSSSCRHLTSDSFDLHRKRPVEHQVPLMDAESI